MKFFENVGKLGWVEAGLNLLLIAGVFLPWTHGYEFPEKFVPVGYNPLHNGLDSNYALAGLPLVACGLLGLAVWFWGLSGSRTALVAGAGLKLALALITLYLVKLVYNDFDYYPGYNTLPWFWLEMAFLVGWIGLALLGLVRNWHLTQTAARKAQS